MPDNINELDNIVVLNDEDGNEVPFEFLDLIEYKSKEYVVLLPHDDAESNEVVILEVDSTSDSEESYISVTDEETLMAVFQIFRDKFKDEFNFVD